MPDVDLIVVGAGVLGTFHAYCAAQRGLTTLLIERNAFPNDASVRNFGILAQSLVHPASAEGAFAHDSREIYRTLQGQLDISLRVPGSMYLASTATECAVLQEFAALSEGYPCTFFDGPTTTGRYSFVQAGSCRGALIFPDDMTVEPRQMLRTVIPFIVETAGVQYCPHTTVIAVERDGQRCRVRDSQGNLYTSDHVIVCSGAEYRTLFPAAFRDSGLGICKLQMMQTVAQPNIRLPHVLLSGLSIRRYPAFTSCPSYVALLDEATSSDLQALGIHLLIKQAADGSVIIGDSHEYDDTLSASVREERTSVAINEAILTYARCMIDLPSWSIAELWNGYYPVHPQQDIFMLAIDERITVVLGSGKGLTLGPGFARLHIDTMVGH